MSVRAACHSGASGESGRGRSRRTGLAAGRPDREGGYQDVGAPAGDSLGKRRVEPHDPKGWWSVWRLNASGPDPLTEAERGGERRARRRCPGGRRAHGRWRRCRCRSPCAPGAAPARRWPLSRPRSYQLQKTGVRLSRRVGAVDVPPHPAKMRGSANGHDARRLSLPGYRARRAREVRRRARACPWRRSTASPGLAVAAPDLGRGAAHRGGILASRPSSSIPGSSSAAAVSRPTSSRRTR
jgi:hypothetical protein